DNAEEVEKFLRGTSREKLHISEFSLYSIGIILSHRNLPEIFKRFVDDLLVTGGFRLLRISISDIETLASRAKEFDLDFDDAYQYVISEKYDLPLVSFDSDFDRTKRGRQIPTA
ncbi:PIN domain-containing protein, partial [Dehalococcoidia bacterium]|nr:PIN domain-containing protein [Dehalococcoidia bacterium]